MGREKVQCGNMTGNDKPAVWEHGQTILRYIKSTHIDGLTGQLLVLLWLNNSLISLVKIIPPKTQNSLISFRTSIPNIH